MISTKKVLSECFFGGIDSDLVSAKKQLERVHIKRASKIIANMMTERKMESSLS